MINLIKSIKPKNFGVIVRTVAEKSVSELDKDLKSLISSWKKGIKKLRRLRLEESFRRRKQNNFTIKRHIKFIF